MFLFLKNLLFNVFKLDSLVEKKASQKLQEYKDKLIADEKVLKTKIKLIEQFELTTARKTQMTYDVLMELHTKIENLDISEKEKKELLEFILDKRLEIIYFKVSY